MAEAIEGVVEPVTFDDGAGSYLPASPSADLRSAVERISQALAPRTQILYGTAISHRGDSRAGIWAGPPLNSSSLILPRTRTRKQPLI